MALRHWYATGHTILHIDDHAGFAGIVALLLRQQGHTVLQARDGRAALDLVDGNRPDLVLSDVRMPGVDGVAMARTLRARGHRMAVVLMSVDFTPPVDLPGVRVLPKPTDAAQLISIVGQALAGPGSG
ncbi:MAG: two-component system, NtrC family, response regulator GlrR [Thermomicrobiales bacterium]|nr:two-component system, NtrC family, response regulator GlrR [Thermomicrobiales bacterium]